MRHYTVDEFLNDHIKDTHINTIIEKKINILYELGILRHYGRHADSREPALRAYLKRYKTENQLTTALHDVVVGNTTIDQLLKGVYTNV